MAAQHSNLVGSTSNVIWGARLVVWWNNMKGIWRRIVCKTSKISEHYRLRKLNSAAMFSIISDKPCSWNSYMQTVILCYYLLSVCGSVYKAHRTVHCSVASKWAENTRCHIQASLDSLLSSKHSQNSDGRCRPFFMHWRPHSGLSSIRVNK